MYPSRDFPHLHSLDGVNHYGNQQQGGGIFVPLSALLKDLSSCSPLVWGKEDTHTTHSVHHTLCIPTKCYQYIHFTHRKEHLISSVGVSLPTV